MAAKAGKETVIIVNPVARNLPSRKRLDEAARWLENEGWSVERRETERPGHGIELAADAAERGLPPWCSSAAGTGR